MPSSSCTNACSILPAEAMRVEYREEPCKTALNPVKGMGFKWSLNPYMGCVHRCTFCYVRHFEHRSDRPSDDRYGTSIRVKTNVADVLRRELARPSWEHEHVAVGAATDPYQPAEGRYKLTRACLEALRDATNPFSIITRGPMILRDLDVLVEASQRASVSVTFSIPTLDEDVWKRTEPSTAHPRQRLKAVKQLVDAGVKTSVGIAPILPGISDRPEPALPGPSGRGLAGAAAAVRTALRAQGVPRGRPDEADPGRGGAARCGVRRRRPPNCPAGASTGARAAVIGCLT